MSSFEAVAAGFAAGALCGAFLAGYLALRRERRLGRFLSFAAHEFNTPLTAVNMTVLNFMSGALGPVDQKQQPWLQMLREQVERAAAIMGDMRDFIHLKLRDGVFFQLEEVDLAAVLEAAVSSVSWGFKQAGFPIKTEVESGMPKVKADADRLQRIISDILYHCRKFRSAGELEISAKAGSSGRVQVDFIYTGIKQAPEETLRSLDLFYPARIRKDQLLTAAGLGLGVLRLFLMKQGGDLSVSIQPQDRFTITMELTAVGG